MTRTHLAVALLAVASSIGCALLLVSILRERAKTLAAESDAQRFREYVEHDKELLAQGGKQLHYYSTGNTDQLLAEFRHRPEVEEVGFEASDVTRTGFEIVAEFPHLKKLYVTYGNPGFNDECFHELANHPHLEEIVLLQTPITDDGLDVLTILPNLRRVRINNWYESNLSEKAIDKLAAPKQLEELKLNGEWVTEDVIAKLRDALLNTRIERDTQGW